MPDTRPTIGITTQTLEAVPDELPRCWVMSQRYVQAMAESGGVPWIIPLMPDDQDTMRCIYEHLDGLLLPGGVDIDPGTYGATRLAACGRTDIDRDRAEVMLTRWALEDAKPVLGICRGVQLINVAAGGTLYQDVATELTGAIKHDYFPHGEENPRDQLVHEVAVAPASRLAALLEERGAIGEQHAPSRHQEARGAIVGRGRACARWAGRRAGVEQRCVRLRRAVASRRSDSRRLAHAAAVRGSVGRGSRVASLGLTDGVISTTPSVHR